MIKLLFAALTTSIAFATQTVDYKPNPIAGFQTPYFVAPLDKSTQPTLVKFKIGLKYETKKQAELRPEKGFYRITIVDMNTAKFQASRTLALPGQVETTIELPKGQYEAIVKFTPDGKMQLDPEYSDPNYRDIDIIRFGVEMPVKALAKAKLPTAVEQVDMSQLQVTPTLKGDELVSFEVRGVAPGSAWESMGLKVGDSIIAINGDKKISAFHLYELKPRDPKTHITAQRNGNPVELNGRK